MQAITFFDKMTVLNFIKCHNVILFYDFYSKMAEKLRWNRYWYNRSI